MEKRTWNFYKNLSKCKGCDSFKYVHQQYAFQDVEAGFLSDFPGSVNSLGERMVLVMSCAMVRSQEACTLCLISYLASLSSFSLSLSIILILRTTYVSTAFA